MKAGAGLHELSLIFCSTVSKPIIRIFNTFSCDSVDLLAPSAVYLYGPIGFMIMANIIFFVLTVLALRRASIDTALAAAK